MFLQISKQWSVMQLKVVEGSEMHTNTYFRGSQSEALAGIIGDRPLLPLEASIC